MNTRDFVLTEKGPRTFLQLIEIERLSHSRSIVYAAVIVLMLTLWLAAAAVFFVTATHRVLVDFDDFYIVGQLVWSGEIEKAYHLKTLLRSKSRCTAIDPFCLGHIRHNLIFW